MLTQHSICTAIGSKQARIIVPSASDCYNRLLRQYWRIQMGNFDENCIFCKIIKGEIPSHKVFEDERFLAFLDISPIEPGHTLVIPKSHCRDFTELSDDSALALGVALREVAKRLREAVNSEGINLISNAGARAGQEVFHAHFHIVPRAAGDGHLNWKPGETDHTALAALAEKIRSI